MTIKHLILGGARSGKSRYAEQITIKIAESSASTSSLIYLATATAGDREMTERIAHHQQQRESSDWQLIEEPINLSQVTSTAPTNATVLIDCLTLWLSNCLHQQCWETQKILFLDALVQSPANIIMVSNDVGSGIVPMGELSRQFVDESGWLHQEIATICNHVSLVVAGLPLSLKAD